MDKLQIISLLLGSAAIGALVSSLMTAWTSHLERKSRREELVLSEAINMGQKNMDVALEVARAGGRPVPIIPLIEMVMDYHKWLKSLLDTGQMPADYVRTVDRPARDR